MGRSFTAQRVGGGLALVGVASLALAGYYVYTEQVVDPALGLALAPLVIAGVVLVGVAYRLRADPPVDGAQRVLVWAVVGGVVVGATADAALLRHRMLDGPLDPLLVVSGVAAVGAAGGGVAALIDTRKRNTVSTLNRRIAELEQSLSSVTGVALVRLDAEGYISGWSEGARTATGFDADSVVGARLDVLYPDDGDRSANQDLQRALRTDGHPMTGEFNRADGTTFYGDGTLTAMENEEGTLHGYVLVLADRTEDRKRERQLERQNEQLEAFASVVSHDLRNPLNVAIGNVQMARSADTDEPLDTAERALERMERLIEEVLTLTKQGRDVDEFDRVELTECVQLAWSSVDGMWAELDHGELPAISGDEKRLRRLFENLFRNAIEHGGEDVRVRVGTLEDDDGFFVADDGPGIPKGRREEVFDAEYSTGSGGTGLGLAIVKGIAEAHGWTVTATEGEAGGARFEFRGVQTLADVP